MVLSLGLGLTMSALFAKTVTEYRDVVREVEVYREREAARDVAADKQVLRELTREYTAAYQLENPTPIARLEELLADDLVTILPLGDVHHGKDAFLAWLGTYRGTNRASFEIYEPQCEIETIRLLGDGATVFAKLIVKAQRRLSAQEQL